MENNAKHFSLQLGALISLYVSIGSLITLLFGIITITFPDVINAYYEHDGATAGIRWGIALLAVFFPAYIILTRSINTERRGTGTPYLGVTKWLIYLSLVVGGAALLGDFVAVIYNFLNGDLTTRFFLKALTLFVVIGLPFLYYLADARGYWLTHEGRSKQYGVLVSIAVVISIITGYMHIETPTEVRAQRLDDAQINDLTTIQSFIESEYSLGGALPTSLDALSSRMTIPEASEERDPYEYRVTSTSSFELCATFANASRPNEFASPIYMSDVGLKNPYDWNHKEGRTCFPRILNEQFVPVVPLKPLM